MTAFNPSQSNYINQKPEAKFEQTIIDYLKNNGYRYVSSKEMKEIQEYNNQYIGIRYRFNCNFAIDEVALKEFLISTQKSKFEKEELNQPDKFAKFLEELNHKIINQGIVKVLKNTFKYRSNNFTLLYTALDPLDENTFIDFDKNIFVVTNQLAYSNQERRKELDLCIMINGFPIVTCELKTKDSKAKYTYESAIEQYKKDRSPLTSTLFQPRRCIAHFAVDDNDVYFTTKIENEGEKTKFMPFNKGKENDQGVPIGAGNPINPYGKMTAYLWEEIFQKNVLISLIRDFCYTPKNSQKLIFPRYHQYRAVNKLVTDVEKNGVGRSYLIQHSAGSGKSNSITWLAYRLVEANDFSNLEEPISTLELGDPPKRNQLKGLDPTTKIRKVFDSVIVVTDRLNLDSQISDNIFQFINETSIVGRASTANELHKLMQEGKKIIISTIQKFPHLFAKGGVNFPNKNFAVIIDEAHSSQSGKSASSLNQVICDKEAYNQAQANQDACPQEELEDMYVDFVTKQKPKNVSFFAFTATPKKETLMSFSPNGSAFDVYSMKQAIEEGFILDVLRNYTPYNIYYKIRPNENEDVLELYDKKNVNHAIRAKLEKNPVTVKEISAIIVDHFISNVYHKINCQAKAMVVTSGVEQAFKFYDAISEEFSNRRTNFKALVAFSGEFDYDGEKLTEAKLNGFSDKYTAREFRENPNNKILVVADKYQTGYDEPLLHTMYVLKRFNSGIRAVQTLSRLNRCCEGKYDTFVLDFKNEPEKIQKAFDPYYTYNLLAGELDINGLNHLLEFLDEHEPRIYFPSEIHKLIDILKNSKEDDFGYQNVSAPILDLINKRFNELKQQDLQAATKFYYSMSKFVKNCEFFAMILPAFSKDWGEKQIAFEMILPRLRLPTQVSEAELVSEKIDLLRFDIKRQETLNISLSDSVGEFKITPIDQDANQKNQEDDKITLQEIVDDFNRLFDLPEWKEEDKVQSQDSTFKFSTSIFEEIEPQINLDNGFRPERFNNAFEESYQEKFDDFFSVALSSKSLSEDKNNRIPIMKQCSEDPKFSENYKKLVRAQVEQLIRKSKNSQYHDKL